MRMGREEFTAGIHFSWLGVGAIAKTSVAVNSFLRWLSEADAKWMYIYSTNIPISWKNQMDQWSRKGRVGLSDLGIGYIPWEGPVDIAII